jgi:hypothetical protein
MAPTPTLKKHKQQTHLNANTIDFSVTFLVALSGVCHIFQS